MALPPISGPRTVWRDLREFWRGRPRSNWIAALFAVLVPIGLLTAFYFDAQTNIHPGETLTYIESWPANRSDAEIIAKQKADLVRRREFEENRRRQFQAIDNKMDRWGL